MKKKAAKTKRTVTLRPKGNTRTGRKARRLAEEPALKHLAGMIESGRVSRTRTLAYLKKGQKRQTSKHGARHSRILFESCGILCVMADAVRNDVNLVKHTRRVSTLAGHINALAGRFNRNPDPAYLDEAEKLLAQMKAIAKEVTP